MEHACRTGGFVDSFDLIVISRLPWAAITTITAYSVAALLAFRFLPRRIAVVALPLVTLATLVGSSIVAAHDLAEAAEARRLDVVGPTPDWIDRNAQGPVTYVYGGEQLWTAVWQERFWNRRIDSVITLGGSPVPGPLPQTMATLPPSGTLPTRRRYVVAPDRFTFIGSPVAHLAQTGLDISGLTLWRLDGQARVSTITNAVQPNGDMTRPATVSVYDCRGGQLQLTLLPKATDRLRILLNGRLALERKIGGLNFWTGEIPVPVSKSSHICRFTILPQPLLGSTHIGFVRPG